MGTKFRKNCLKETAAIWRWRHWLESLRRRELFLLMERKRRRLLLLLLLLLFGKKPAYVRPLLLRQDDQPFDYDAHILRDFAVRPGEEAREVFDGLTPDDIAKIRREFSVPKIKIPGLPERYSYEWPHLFTLFDHLKYDFLRKDALTVLKLMTPFHVHNWLEMSVLADGGKAIRMCRCSTVGATLALMPHAAARWRHDLEIEAKAREQKTEQAPIIYSHDEEDGTAPSF